MPYQCPVTECGSTHDSEQGLAMHLRHKKDAHGDWPTISSAYQDIGNSDYYVDGPADDVDDGKSQRNQTPSPESGDSAPDSAPSSSDSLDPSRQFPPDEEGQQRATESVDDGDDVDDVDDGEIVCPSCGGDLFDYRGVSEYQFDYYCGGCETGFVDE